MATEPLPIGKISTVVQVLYILVLLVMLAFDVDAPRLAGAFAWICGLATIVSAAAYANVFFRGVFPPGRPA